MVYSSHVLEHIPNPEKALQEIYRVLKPNGINFCVVPTRADKVYAFFNFYSYLIYRTLSRIKKVVLAKFQTNKSDLKSAQQNQTKSSSWLVDFPFPPPHGHYPHYLEELKRWTPSRWRNRCLAAAPFQMEKQCTTQFNPLLSLLGAFAPKWGTQIHKLTRRMELKFGKMAFFRAIGLNTVMMLKK
jgi:SAM-dependent methyltransferase